MKSMFILILASLLTSFNHSNDTINDNFLGQWTMSMSTTEASNMDVCHKFIFNLKGEGKGTLSVELSLINEPNNFDVFVARIPFDYTTTEERTNEYTGEIKVAYSDKVAFSHVKMNRENRQAIPGTFMDYVKQLEEELSDLNTAYQLSLDGRNFLVVQNFSLVKNTSFANFKRGGGVESCNDLK